MATRLNCPSCGRWLTVSDNAPLKLTCPNCLGRIVNPTAGQVKPLPVIPVDQQVATDTSSTRWLFIGLVIVVGVGAFLTATTLGAGPSLMPLLVLGLIITFLVFAIVGAQRIESQPKANRPVDSSMPPPTPLYPGEPPLLPYRNYRGFTPQEPTRAGAVVGGFFSAMAVCAVGFFVLAATVDNSKGHHAIILLLVVSGVIAFMFSTPALSHRPGWNGYGRGVTIGLTLGLIALGPCAFCYTMTFP
jgi:hypothetical protein